MFVDDTRVQGDSNHTEVTIMKTVHSTPRTYLNGGRARWLAWTLAGCILAVGPLIADRSRAHELDVVAISNVYKPGFSAGRRGPGGNAQDSEQWSGTVAVPDPLGLQLAPDVYEFDVASFDEIWAALPGAINDAGLKFVSANRDDRFVRAQRGMTAFSYGENVAVFVEPIEDGRSSVEVVSKKAMQTNVFAPDWTKAIFRELDKKFKRV